MEYSFTCYGHENVTSRHKTTLEFTKDSELSLKGDCIVGLKADFSLVQLKKFIDSKINKKITITIETINDNKLKNNGNLNEMGGKIIETINAEINPDFNSDKEIVIRKSDFVDGRTFAINADKAAVELNKDLIGFLRVKENKIRVIFKTY